MIQEIASLLFTLIVQVLELSLWVVAVILLILSCCVPWRLPSVIYVLIHSNGITHWRLFFVSCFFMTLLDLVTLPLGIVSVLFPTITASLCSVTFELLSVGSWTGHEADKFVRLRIVWCASLFMAAIDVVLGPLGFFQAFVPSRNMFFFKNVLTPVLRGHDKDNLPVSWRNFCRTYCELRQMWVLNFFLGVIDIISAWSGLVAFSTVLRSRVLYLDLCTAWRDETATRYMQYSVALRTTLLYHGVGALLDIICLPFGLLSCLSPARAIFFCRVTCAAYYPCPRDESARGGDESDVSSLRLKWLINFVLAVCDFIAAFFGFVAFALVVRGYHTYCELREALELEYPRAWWEEKMQYNSKARLVLVANGVTMLLDILFLPLVVLIGVTCVRFQPVVEAFRQGLNWKTRVVIMQQFSRLVVDVLLLPALILVLLTAYRAPSVFCDNYYWRHAESSNTDLEEAELTHPILQREVETYDPGVSNRACDAEENRDNKYVVPTDQQFRLIWGAFFVLCDVLVLPCILILVVTWYRCERVCCAARMHPDSLAFHRDVLKECWSFLLDLPFLLMGLFVVITLYRIDFLCAGIEQAKKKPDAEFFRACRWLALEQFGKVWRDVVCLVPLCIVFLSFYRLLSWCAKLKVAASKPLHGTPETAVTDLSFVFQRPGKGTPKMLITLQKDVNLCDVKELSLRVLGSEFYRVIGDAFGTMVASGAQAIATSLTLTNEQVDVSVIAKGCNNVCLEIGMGGTHSFEWIMAQVGKLESVSSTAPLVSVLIQLEATFGDGERLLLAAVGVPVEVITTAIRAENESDAESPAVCLLSMRRVMTDEATLARLRGRAEDFNLRDAWAFFTLEEAAYVVKDILRLCWHCLHFFMLVLLLVLSPFRGFRALQSLFETNAHAKTKIMKNQLAYMDELEEACQQVAAKVEELGQANSKAAVPKAAFVNASRTGEAYSDIDRATYCVEGCIGCCCCIYCPMCPNYFDTRRWFCDDDELEDRSTNRGHPMWQRDMSGSNFGKRLANAAETTDALADKFKEFAIKCDDIDETEAKELQQRFVRRVFVLWYEAFFWMLAGARIQEKFAKHWGTRKLADIDDVVDNSQSSSSNIRTRTRYAKQEVTICPPAPISMVSSSSNKSEATGRKGHLMTEYLLEMQRLAVTTDQMRAKAEHSLQVLVEVRADMRMRWAKLEMTWAAEAARAPCRLAPEPHSRIRSQWLRALGDYLALPFFLLIALTLYRLPGFCQDASRGKTSFQTRLKNALKKHTKGLIWDAFELLQLIILGAILVGTVVKLPDFLYGFNPFKGLHRMVRWAMLNVAELVMGIMEFLMLLTFWKTYRMFVSSIVFGLFAPAGILTAALPGGFTYTSRFVVVGPVWTGWLACVLTFSSMKGMWNLGWGIGIIGIPIVLTFVGMTGAGVPGWLKPRVGDWWTPQVRVTPLNAVVLIVVVVEAVMLAAVVMFQKDGTTHGDEWRSLTTLGAQQLKTLAIVSFFIMGASALVAALPLVAYDDEERAKLVSDPRWVVVTTFLLELLFLPVTWAAWPTLVGDDASKLHVLIFVYYVFAVVMLPAMCESPLGPETRLDVRYTGLYAAGHKILLLAAVVTAWDAQTVPFIASATGLFAWTLMFLIHGCSVSWVQVLRLGISSGALAALEKRIWSGPVFAWGVVFVLAVIAFVISKLDRQQSLSQAENLPAVLDLLRKTNARSSLWGGAYSLRSSKGDSPQFIARELLAMEVALPFERLHFQFMAQRGEWRSKLQQASDYSVVQTAATLLVNAIFVPPSATLLNRLLAKVPGYGRLGFPGPLRMKVIAFVGLADGSTANLHIQSLTPPDNSTSYKGSKDLAILWDSTECLRYTSDK
eukprot:TRINITY_DN67681_c0_g1_i1.p1 TRINITY_DN67681_c0_g1~~TRINITY_DN67681_c0_g1_i1.p1  ORF type:complete len:1852 (+),score=274.27 TRINITY_DN67681_c0_g1_i1:77-5632(+)